MRILVVDDIEESRYLLEALLKGNGYDVETASNGAEAIEKLEAISSTGLIISDILMPVMDGFQLCKKVKADRELRNIPFIFYTATYTGPKDEAFAYRVGANRFVVKPCEPDELIKIVREVTADTSSMDSESDPVTTHEEEILKLYNERLINKLEKKMLDLEKEAESRKKTETELRQANVFLDSIVENIPDMVFLKDAKDLRLVRVNRAVEKMMGCSREKMIGKSDYSFFPKKQADSFIEQDHDVLSTKEILDIPEEELRTKNFGTRLLRTKKVPIVGPEGEILYILGISEDVTELKHAEEEQKKLARQLFQAQKLEAIGTLAGGIAHDFNNILSAIMGYTDLALIDTERGSTTEGYLQHVHKAGKRAKDLVSQILSLARGTNQEFQPVRVRPLLKEALGFIRSSTPATIEIRQNIISNASVFGNSTEMHQVIMNLCTNAVQAMEERGGKLDVSLEDITIEQTSVDRNLDLKQGNYILLTVKDTGPGISTENISAIFEPYYSTKTSDGGTGLGLSVVSGIVKNYGGLIDVKSNLGKGSAFSIYLPVFKEEYVDPPYESGDLPTGSERILFIDDELSIAKMGCQILESLGYSVKTQTSSIAALELFRTKPDDFDLVVTDMTMPKMTGDELAVELLKIRKDVPIILCTGYSKKITDTKAAEIGVKAIAYKPMAKTELARAIRKVLDDNTTKEA